MAEKQRGKAESLLERDRLYAEHMYRKELARPNERDPRPSDALRLQSQPGAFERFVLWCLGD